MDGWMDGGVDGCWVLLELLRLLCAKLFMWGRMREREREGGRERERERHGGGGNSHANVPRDCLMLPSDGGRVGVAPHARTAHRVSLFLTFWSAGGPERSSIGLYTICVTHETANLCFGKNNGLMQMANHHPVTLDYLLPSFTAFATLLFFYVFMS